MAVCYNYSRNTSLYISIPFIYRQKANSSAIINRRVCFYIFDTIIVYTRLTKHLLRLIQPAPLLSLPQEPAFPTVPLVSTIVYMPLSLI